MKIISCHLFPRRKTGTNLPREAIRPPPLGIVWIRARMSDKNFIFYFLHVAGLAIILEKIGRTAQVRWLICAFIVCIQKSFSRKWVKKLSCKFKYTRTVNERLFRPFFSYLKASNFCGVSGTISLTLDMHLHLHSLYVSIYAPGKTVRMCRLVRAFAGCMCERYHNLMN